MARTRNLKPGFFQNETLSSLPPLARLFFAGLWCWADREGRLEDRPKKLKAMILPYDNADGEELLRSLAESPEQFIVRYKINGCRYIQLPTFVQHQNPHCKEQPSTIPAPDLPGAEIVHPDFPLHPLANHLPPILSPRTSSATTVQEPGIHGQNGKAKHRKYEYSVEFMMFWEQYPRKVKKPEAKQAYDNAVERLSEQMSEEEAHVFLCKRAKAFAESDSGIKAESFCPYPATWLNQERYDEDETTWKRFPTTDHSSRILEPEEFDTWTPE